jgi:predicted metalloprotease with PDZ domain
MSSRARVVILAGGLIVGMAGSRGMSAEPATATVRASEVLRIEVDARDLPRKLLHSRIQLSCRPGVLGLWYPKWVPGTHAPCGPVQNVAGLVIEAAGGKVIPWKRDEVEPYRVECVIPAGVDTVTVRLDTICNEPAVLAAGYLSFGNRSVGVINWNTCVMYPEGLSSDQVSVDLRLRLPRDWKFASALRAYGKTINGGKSPLVETAFQRVSLTELLDRPLIGGEHLRTIALETGKYPPALFHVVSESASALELSPKVVNLYSRVVQEAGALFELCHYDSFDFLVTCSDELGYLGLEHLRSSLNGVRERDLIDDSKRRGWVANLIPHEYVHSWCGKFRRPAGMCVADFQTPERTKLLWVYEGLTEYLGEVLMVRSGLIDAKEYREMLAATISTLSHREGRRWRPLEDTAVASHLLRGSSANWNELRREQDYYYEGALLWLEVDAIIREKTGGKSSLDDFCRKFFGANESKTDVVPYELSDVVTALRGVVVFDWEGFFKRRVTETQESLPMDVVSRCGYRLGYSREPSGYLKFLQEGRANGAISALDSLGVSFAVDGRVLTVVPGMAGDRAKLAPGMKVIGVNGKTFGRQRLVDALADSVAKRKVELLLIEGDEFRTVVIDYGDGLRYLELVRDSMKPDLLEAILTPLGDRAH